MKKYLTLFLAAILLFLIGFGAYSLSRARKAGLTFTNTMEWNDSYLAKSTDTPLYIPNFKQYIKLDPPPANSSQETKEEINSLLVHQKKRTKDQISIINDQILPETTYFGGQIMDSYFHSKLRPHTALALNQAFADLSIVLFYEKAHFDRVRPSALDFRIKPAIPVPGHPAYPSGHSTEFHFLSLFLGELRPEDKESLWAEADTIAKNREIAGLHYPSDSLAGAKLAEQVFVLLLANPEFKALFEDARTEWR
ncbi:MAG: phosphatase PAP2 family protein [bacterium]|nr:phosphatase PAP2 family protein [bacterium]